MIVCIAEKPSVAKDIAKVLGANQSHKGYMEGNGYQVTWTFGHLCELKEPHEYDPAWKIWKFSDLPMIPPRFGIKLKDDKGVKEQFEVIRSLFAKADSIINCGDAGQEGELIQRWVMQKAGVTCPVRRLWISSLTEDAIREGFNSLKDQSEYQSLYEAGLGRAIGDWTLGMNATRLYTLKYGQFKQVLSIGRVQTPTLALIVKRQKEIDNFKPEPYWELKTIYRNVTFNATKGRFSSEEEGRAFYEEIAREEFYITDVSKKNGTEAPQRLYDLTSLQVDCNRKFGYSADLTLQLIQSLYEKKYTTYPRVDTTFLSDDIYPKCPGILKGLTAYSGYTQPLEGKKLPKSKKVFDSSKVTDHHAIIPTGVPATDMTDMERRVYDLVARRFISVFYPDCRFSTTTVLAKVLQVEFKATGKQILDPGWRILYQKPVTNARVGSEEYRESLEEDKEEEQQTLPEFTPGEHGPHTPSLQQKFTQPPKPYTEATLLRAMETAGKVLEDEELRDAMKENGIGRPSTRAEIIKTLFRRHYIRQERKSLVATQTGIELIDMIQVELLKSAELTGQWEKKLRMIERRSYDTRTFIDELKEMVRQLVIQVMQDNSNRRVSVVEDKPKPKRGRSGGTAAPKPSTPKPKPAAPKMRMAGDWLKGTVCPVCGQGTMLKGKAAYGCSRWKEGCNYRIPFDSEVKI